MKSKGDPILDLQEACTEKPMAEDDLRKVYKELGWGPPFEDVFKMASGVYIEKGADGLFRRRDGNTKEIAAKVLAGG